MPLSEILNKREIKMKYLIILLTCILVSCNYDIIIDEYSDTRVSEPSCVHKVNIIVDNQAPNVTFETDSIVLQYKEEDICKTFNTKNYYIDSIVLNGRLYTPYYTIYNGGIHIPIKRRVINSINNIDIVLYDGCPWYSDSGYKILQSIQFGDPTVDNWVESNN